MKSDREQFDDFMIGNIPPPEGLQAELFERIRAELNPPLYAILLKLFSFHVVGSFLTLLLCPQFGISLFGSEGFFPTHRLMQIHPGLCFLFCGGVWMVFGQALTYVFLTLDEHRVIGAYRWGGAFTVMLLSLLAFGCLGAVQFDEWLAFWAVGALGVTTFFNWRAWKFLKRSNVHGNLLGF